LGRSSKPSIAIEPGTPFGRISRVVSCRAAAKKGDDAYREFRKGDPK